MAESGDSFWTKPFSRISANVWNVHQAHLGYKGERIILINSNARRFSSKHVDMYVKLVCWFVRSLLIRIMQIHSDKRSYDAMKTVRVFKLRSVDCVKKYRMPGKMKVSCDIQLPKPNRL